MRTSARIAGVAAAAVLLVGGCGSDSDDGDSGGNASQGVTAGGSQGTTGGGEQNGGGGGDLQGVWRSEDASQKVSLVIRGQNAILSAPGRNCTGTFSGEGTINFDMKCPMSDDFSGTAQHNGDTLTADFGSGQVTLKKLGDVPTDIPTENMPTDLPTDLDVPTDIPTDLDIPTDGSVPELP